MTKSLTLLVALFSMIVLQRYAAQADSAVWRTTGERTVFEITDTEVLKPVTSGRWRLSGTLEVKFTGRIKPHESSVLRLFGPGVEAIEG